MLRIARVQAFLAVIVGALVLGGSSSAVAEGSSDVAALQVALRSQGLYSGSVDGFLGPETTGALVEFQRGAGLEPDGVAGPATRSALGQLGGPELGARTIELGAAGWDVAELQFLLAWRGFPSGTIDGTFGTRLEAAVRRYQRYAGLLVVGFAGPATVAALSGPQSLPALSLARPVEAALGDGFGPRRNAFHAGLDFLAAAGTPVGAAAPGLVTFAGPSPGGWGNLVVVAHGDGVRTLYAHLATVELAVGDRVAIGGVVGRVGATGRASGPHLHFEVRVRGAAVDPLTALS